MSIDYTIVVYLIIDSATIVTVTYYRVQFIVDKSATRYILNNLFFVDKHLNVIGVRVTYRRDGIKCVVYIGFVLTAGLLSTSCTLQRK